MLRATMNRPAVVEHLLGPNGVPFKGLETRVEDGRVAFHPTNESSSENINVVSFKMRERGNAEIIFNGPDLNLLRAALENPYENPYFLLKREKGWFIPVPFYDPSIEGRNQEPSRTTPHFRVWQRGARRGMISKVVRRERPVTEVIFDFTNAINVVKTYYSSSPAGRVPKEVNDALAILKSFEMIARRLPLKKIKPNSWRDTSFLGSLDLEDMLERIPAKAKMLTPLAAFAEKLPDVGSPYIPPQPQPQPQASSRKVTATKKAAPARIFDEDEDVPAGEDEVF